MKKITAAALILLLFFGAYSFVSANNSTVKMRMDGRNIAFHVVQLKLNGNLIPSDVPPVLHNDRTLVPIGIIMRNTNADVAWDAKKYEVTIKTADKEIVLKIDSPTAIVNGREIGLPDNVPPKIINDRTMVPIRFVAEVIGLEVGWDSNTRTVIVNEKPGSSNPDSNTRAGSKVVQDIRVLMNGSTPEIRIKTSEKVEHKEFMLSGPDRIVFDLIDARFELTDSSKVTSNGTFNLNLSNSILIGLRASQFETEPYITRIVADIGSSSGHTVHYDETTKEMVISFMNYIRNVKVERINAKEVLVIEGDAVKDYNIMRLDNPARLVVDIKNSYMDPDRHIAPLNINGRVARAVRVSQFMPDHHYNPDDKIVRVVVDLQNNASSEDFPVEVVSNRLIVHLEGKPYDSFLYEETGWTSSVLTLKGSEITNYEINHNRGTNVINITVPKRSIALPANNIRIEDHFIQNILIEETNGGKDYKITIQLKNGVEYAVMTALQTRDLVIQFTNKDIKYRELLIVIDPGHGGRDPGAISPNLKIAEKELVLDVSMRLNKLLTQVGFRTYMTRVDDSTVSLQDRAGAANQLMADLFVSVHANAAANSNINGVENLYYPCEIDPSDNRDNKRLAQIFQREMINNMQAFDRGIVARERLFVLRETDMPAVITEIGFLTNAAEEAKLARDDYRQLTAESIFKSIVKYFEETRK